MIEKNPVSSSHPGPHPVAAESPSKPPDSGTREPECRARRGAVVHAGGGRYHVASGLFGYQILDFLVARTAHYEVEHCYSCAIPGYLIVSPTAAAESIFELSEPARSELGAILARATSLVTRVVRPLRVYCAQFGEEDSRLHFHVFPRTADVTARFVAEFPEQARLIHGPVLLDWARTTFAAGRDEVWSAVAPVVDEMRRLDAADRR